VDSPPADQLPADATLDAEPLSIPLEAYSEEPAAKPRRKRPQLAAVDGNALLATEPADLPQEYSEDHLAEEFSKRHAEDWRYVKRWDKWFKWSGGDNSMTILFNEDSDGNAHNLNNLPILQAGSCGGRFKTGQAVNVENGDADLSRGNSVGPCDGGGEIPFGEVTSTGTPPELGNAPINKYFCNIMNALGVKASADGFPAEGGTQEVTHYGRYDRTEDFVGGGNNPANITDPGEFADLLANA
jgi:hypothetical protein